jgi:HK97 family phage portal protein
MGLFRRREIETKSTTFEDWVAQGLSTGFLPPDTSTWPIATMTGQLQDAVSSMQAGPASYSAIYRSQPAVYTVVEFLSWQLSQLGLKVYRRESGTERVEMYDSPLAQILRDPAPGMTYTRFIQRLVLDLCVYGNAYWAKLQAPGGERDLAPLPVASVTPRGGTLLEANTYDVALGNRLVTFSSDQIVHFRRNNPDDARIGVSPLEPLRAILREEYESSRYRANLWKKEGRQAGFIVRPRDANPMTDTSRKNFRAGLRKFVKGGVNENEWMLLEEGEEPRPVAFSPKEAEFIAGRKLTLETVARAFNIPLPVLGLTETATYASQREHHQALYQDTLPPWTRLIEDEIEAKVVPWFTSDESVYVEFNLQEKLKGAFEDSASMLLAAGGGPYMTRNEVRARLNLPRVEDPQADELVLTNNMSGTEGSPNQPEQQQQSPNEPNQPAPVVSIVPPSQGANG